MNPLIVLLIVLVAILIGVVLILKRQSLRYENKRVKETLSPAMQSELRRERALNLARKQRFDETLENAQDTSRHKSS